MATRSDLSSAAAAAVALPAKKDRHIVSWSPEEDDLLREQIGLHGTDNWTIIAAQFNDKTSRQCRRRWYNYLNSECKKGGWSQEEDTLLCEAQKILGNRWTEIAKVVSGRTDNAVKNRFSTLCKKRAKHESFFKESAGPCVNTNAKRVLTENGCLTAGSRDSEPPIKQRRSDTSDLKENAVTNVRLYGQQQSRQSRQEQSRQPLAVLSSNFGNVNQLDTQGHVANNTTKPLYDGITPQSNFLKRDDPKLANLLQQAELLSSLAKKVNAENTSQSMDEAWKQLQDYLIQTEENGMLESDMSGLASLLEDLDNLIVDAHTSKEEDEQKLRELSGQIGVHEHSYGASETSMEVTSQVAYVDQNMDSCPLDDNIGVNNLHKDVRSARIESSPGGEMPLSEKLNEVAKSSSRRQDMEFASPVHTVPTFQSFADGIPSPKFTASERSFLLSVLELTSPGSKPETCQQPSCKRALLDSL